MAARKPLVVVSGVVQEMSQFDTVDVPTQSSDSRSNRPASTEFVHNVIGGLYSVTTTGGTVVVSEASSSSLSITVLGTLTANAVLDIPSSARRLYCVSNETSGPFTVAIRQGGAQAFVSQGRRSLIRVNGFGATVAQTDFPDVELTGLPKAPTAPEGTDSTQIANMAAVQAAKVAAVAAANAATASATAIHPFLLIGA